jgi:lipopolysaccharide export LptBFGC system permease protein LptF
MHVSRKSVFLPWRINEFSTKHLPDSVTTGGEEMLALFERLAGRLGLLATTALFAFTYAGSGSLALVLTMALAGALFAYAVHSSGRLGAALGGHVLLSLGAGVLLPALLGTRAAGSVPALATTTVVVAFAILVPVALAYTSRRDTA